MLQPPSAPFADLAATAEAAGATSKRLEKMALLGAYFAGLDDADLAMPAASWPGARSRPTTSGRSTSAGRPSSPFCATLAGIPPESYGALHVTTGDIGEVAARILPPAPPHAGSAADPGRCGRGL